MTKFNDFEKNIDFSFWKELCHTKGKLRRYRRGECFAHTGDVIKRVGWVETGSFKHSLINEKGERKSIGFVFAGSVLANYQSAMMHKPLPNDIVALENSEVLEIPVSIIRDHIVNDPTLNLKLAQELFAQAYESMLDNYRYSAQQRYEMLVRRCPRILDTATVGDIASFLNISRRQLHRIMKR